MDVNYVTDIIYSFTSVIRSDSGEMEYRDLTWRITGMTCQKCVRLITEALQGFEEVQQVGLFIKGHYISHG